MEVEVDRDVYYKDVMKEYKILSKTNPSPKEFMTKQWVDIMIQRIVAAEAVIAVEGYESLHESVKTTLRTYSLEALDDKKEKLILLAKPLPGKLNYKIIVPLQESYDVIQKAHNATNHGNPKDMEAWLVRNKYMVHNMCSGVYRKLCAKCRATPFDTPSKQNVDELNEAVVTIASSLNEPDENQERNEPTVSIVNTGEDVFAKMFREEESFQHVCSIDILDLTDNPDHLYKYLLIHQDRKTKFVQLRPMTSASETEISIELIKILMDFCPPECIVVDSDNRTIFNNICEKIKVLTHNDIALALHKSENKLIKIVAQNIVQWMQSQDCKNWGTGCHIVQWNMNNKPDSDGNTPFSKIFGYKYTGSGYKSKFEPENNNSDDIDCIIDLNPDDDGDDDGNKGSMDEEISDKETYLITGKENDLNTELDSLANSSVFQSLGKPKEDPGGD